MPIADNNAERRTLFLTSVGFILYYLGGGHIKDEVIQQD